MTTEQREIIRTYYSDNFLSEVCKVLNLPAEYKFNSETPQEIECGDDQLVKLKALCVENKNLREIFNSKNIATRLTPEWSYSVLDSYFKIKLD